MVIAGRVVRTTMERGDVTLPICRDGEVGLVSLLEGVALCKRGKHISVPLWG